MTSLLGSLLVILSSSAAGFVLAGAVARRPRELQDLQAGLALLETEVAYGAVPLPAALARAAAAGGLAARCFGPAGRRTAAGDLPAAALRAAMAEADWAAALRPEDWEPLAGLALVLGASDRDDQIRHLRLCRERLAAAELAAEAERRRSEPLYRYLGVLVGIAVAIVLA